MALLGWTGLTFAVRRDSIEITDLLWSNTADGRRQPVMKADVVAALASRGQRHASRLVARMPAVGGVLEPAYVDALGHRVHCELQRLGEELQFGRRVAALLTPVVDRLRHDGPDPVRVVDVGCGLGFVIRALAAGGDLGDRVELVGVDLNPVLVQEATRLAAAEDLDCEFITGDALRPGIAAAQGPRTIVISSGLLHHLPASDLQEFFAAQAALDVALFAHWDIAPCLWSTLGAWVFHRARMREPVSRHDGVLSARRAHPADVLLNAAQTGAPCYQNEVLEGGRWHPRALDVLRPIVGTRP
jgi:SAM-dependent methyltransferase